MVEFDGGVQQQGQQQQHQGQQQQYQNQNGQHFDLGPLAAAGLFMSEQQQQQAQGGDMDMMGDM